MMDFLLGVADEIRPGLQETLYGGISQSVVQGALLEVDPYWYWCALARHMSYWGLAIEHRPSMRRDVLIGMHRIWWTFGNSQIDWQYRPPDWHKHCEQMGYSTDWGEPQPVIIRVLLRDRAEAERVASMEPRQSETGGGDVPEFGEVNPPRTFRGYPIIYETRPSAFAAADWATFAENVPRAAGGARAKTSRAVSIGRAEPNTSGTGGGCLRDSRTGQTYIVSCAHVLGPEGTPVFTPGPFEGKSSRQVGVVRYSAISPLKLSGQACSLDTSPDAGRLDIAVAELQENVSVAGAPDRVRGPAQMLRFQPVMFTGKTSGTVEAQLNAVTVWQEFYTHPFGDGPAGFRCFGGVFELAGREDDNSPVAAGGDSGAWIVDDLDGLRSWNGVVIATQGNRAYACFAERLLEAVRGHGSFPDGLSLSL